MEYRITWLVEALSFLMQRAGYGGGFTVDYRTWDSDEFNNSGVVPLIIEDLAAIGIRINVTRHERTEARRPARPSAAATWRPARVSIAATRSARSAAPSTPWPSACRAS